LGHVRFKYDNVAKGTVTAGIKTMVDFNNKIIIMPDKKYYDYKTDTFGTIGAGVYPAAGSCPDMTDITTFMNRIFGINGKEVYASARGEYNDFTTFVPTDPNDLGSEAWQVRIEQQEDYIAIDKYQNHVVIFKPNSMFELYGAYPTQFRIQEVAEVGCCDRRSIAEVSNVLFFAHRSGIYNYSGGMPKLISQKLNIQGDILEAIAGTDGRMYYVSIKTAAEQKLFVYDTE